MRSSNLFCSMVHCPTVHVGKSIKQLASCIAIKHIQEKQLENKK